MPKTSENAAGDALERPVESEEWVDFDEDNDQEEIIEEEVEYEEIEEEIEVEVEEEEEEEDEEEEEEVEKIRGDIESNGKRRADDDEEMKHADAEEEDRKNKHAELLALPEHGSEIYLGGIPQEASEEDIWDFCETIGEVNQVRIMKGKDAGEAKGYAFVTFKNNELASKAIEELNNSQLKGKKIRCSTSQAKNRLFIGNVPRHWGEEDLRKALIDVGPGVIAVELLKDPHNSSRNRGFVFVVYYNHACADYSRQNMSTSKFKLDTNTPTVSWADPRNAESPASSQVKALYVKNLPKDITQDDLKALFDHHGKITKVVVPPAKAGQENSRFGFVHFADRSSAMNALKNTKKYEISGHVLECSLAKPQADQKSFGASYHQNSSPLPAYPLHLGYGMVGSSPFAAMGAGYGAGYGAGVGFAQPLIYGRGPTPAGMAMMPMLLPDGRTGYVLQQPGIPGLQPHAPPPHSRGGRSSGSSSGGRRGNDSNRSRSRYSPYN